MNHKVIYIFSFALSLFCGIDGIAQYTKYYFPDSKTLSSEGTLVNGKPDGYWKTYYQDGGLKTEGNRKELKLEGNWIFYREDSTLERSIEYQADLKFGVERIYSKKGILIEEYTYLNNIKEGLAKTFYNTGELQKIFGFKNNKEEGKATEFAEDGRIITMISYRNGFIYNSEKINRYNTQNKRTGIWRDLYENGSLKVEGNYANGLRNGIFKFFDRKANLEKMEKYVDGVLASDDGESAVLDIRKEYFEDGTLKLAGSYREDKKHGTFREFDSLGKEISGFLYENGLLVGEGMLDSLGRRIGKWKLFYNSGETRAEGEYIEGLHEGPWKYFHQNGKVEQTGVYKSDLATGQWRWFYGDGTLHRDEYYRRGREDGHAIEYDSLAVVINEGDYTDGAKNGPWKLTINDHTEEGIYLDGELHGEWVWNYDNAKKAFEGEFSAGSPIGKHKYWYRSGQLKMRGEYLAGELHGRWEYYDEIGTLELQMEYEAGLAVKINGQKIRLPSTLVEDN